MSQRSVTIPLEEFELLSKHYAKAKKLNEFLTNITKKIERKFVPCCLEEFKEVQELNIPETELKQMILNLHKDLL